MMSNCLHIKNINVVFREGDYTLIGQADDGISPVTDIYFTSEQEVEPLMNIGDPFLCSMLMPAMKNGNILVIDAPVSQSLYDVVNSTIQNIYLRWDQSLNRVKIQAEIVSDLCEGKKGQAAFFSGGLDSLYTLNKYIDDITHTVFVWGFDISLDNEELWSQSKDILNDAAERYKKTPVYVKTNLKQWSSSRVDWGMYHGGALAAVGHFISGAADTVYIGSSHTYEHLFPWGSHPLLDPLWSTSCTKFIHDGCEATRIQKAEAISSDQTALDILRVCYKNPKGAYNCGKCDKCLRTMMNLKAVGALERCNTLPHELDYKKISSAEILNESALSFFLENRCSALRTGQVELVAALDKAISRQGKKHIKSVLNQYIFRPLWGVAPGFVKNIIRLIFK